MRKRIIEMEEGERWRTKPDVLIDAPIVGLASNLALEKFPGNHKDDPSEDPRR